VSNFYTAQQAAAKLGISARRVRVLCAEGKLHANKFGKSWLIPAAALDQYEPGKVGRPPKSD